MNSSTIKHVQVILITSLILSCCGKSKLSNESKYNRHDEKSETGHQETDLNFSKLSGEDIAGVIILQEHLLQGYWNLSKSNLISGNPSFEVALGERKTQFKLLNIEKSERNSVLVYSVSGGISGTVNISLNNTGDIKEVDFRPGFFGHDSMNTKVKLLN